MAQTHRKKCIPVLENNGIKPSEAVQIAVIYSDFVVTIFNNMLSKKVVLEENRPGTRFYGNGVYGALDFPVPGVTIPRREVSVSGHVFHVDGHECDVHIFIDGEFVERARWGLPRYDVYERCMVEESYQSGFVVRTGLKGILKKDRKIEAIVECDGREVRLGPVKFSSGKLKGGDDYVPRLVLPAGGSGVYRSGGHDFLNLLITSGGLVPDHTVIEIGCGMGRGALPLTKFLNVNANYFGVDVVREVIRFCSENISKRYPNFLFQHINVENAMYNPAGESKADSFRLPFADATADLIFLWSVFTHMRPSDIHSYLNEISRILNSGAALVASYFLMTPDRLANLDQQKGLKFESKVEDFWTTRPDQPEQAIAVSDESLKAMYGNAGFTIDEIMLSEGAKGVVGSQDVVVARVSK